MFYPSTQKTIELKRRLPKVSQKEQQLWYLGAYFLSQSQFTTKTQLKCLANEWANGFVLEWETPQGQAWL